MISIKTNFSLCSGCEICRLACSERLLGGYNPARAAIRVIHRRENLYHFPIVCDQCRNPYCANVCPVGAIVRDETTGALAVDRKKCTGCGLCAEYCPIEMIHLDPDSGKALKCDLCGGDPACVAACPTGALEISLLPGGTEEKEAEAARG